MQTQEPRGSSDGPADLMFSDPTPAEPERALPSDTTHPWKP